MRHTEINYKCCKDVVKTDLPFANRYYIRVSKTATIEWVQKLEDVDGSLKISKKLGV